LQYLFENFASFSQKFIPNKLSKLGIGKINPAKEASFGTIFS